MLASARVAEAKSRPASPRLTIQRERIAGISEGRIAHIGGLEGNSARCTVEIRKREFPEYHAEVLRREVEQRALNDCAGDGLDMRWENQGRDICGL